VSRRVLTSSTPHPGLMPCSVSIHVDRQGRMTIIAADADGAGLLQAVLDAAYGQVEQSYLDSLGLDDAGREGAASRRSAQRVTRLAEPGA
jgi:hypothetical protein